MTASPSVANSPPRRAQLTRSFSLAFVAPPEAVLEGLDHWLAGVLGIELPQEPTIAGFQPSPQERHAADWLQRILLLARELFQTGRVPVFDAPHITALAADGDAPGRWQATVALARVDNLDPGACHQVLAAAFRLGAWAGAHPVNEPNRQAFFRTIEVKVTEPLSARMPGGKSTLALLRVAHARGIPFVHLGCGVFQLGWGAQARRVERSTTEADPSLGAKLARNKAITARLLRMAGLAPPRHHVVDNEDDALTAARRLGWPVVVKPANRERGEGVTVNVSDEPSLRAAVAAAAAQPGVSEVLVEQQVAGVCHRLFMAGGQLLYAVRRLPMSVVGDGRSSIADLVDTAVRQQAALPPWKRSEIRPLDALARACLQAAGTTESAVPARGERIALRPIETTEWGGVDEEVTQDIHPENLRIAVAAADLFSLRVAGVDIISPDISRPWFENGAIINEVNFAPMLGAGEVSRRCIARYLDGYLGGDGRIPVEIFLGGEAAWSAANARCQALRAGGPGAWLTRADLTLTPSGEPWHLPFAHAYDRARALVLSRNVQAIVLVVQTDEFLDTGLPFDAVSRLVRVDVDGLTHRASQAPLAPDRLQALLSLLAPWQDAQPPDEAAHQVSLGKI